MTFFMVCISQQEDIFNSSVTLLGLFKKQGNLLIPKKSIWQLVRFTTIISAITIIAVLVQIIFCVVTFIEVLQTSRIPVKKKEVNL